MARRAEKKHSTRVALIRAAHGLFLAQGYDAVTIDQIVETVGISKRTFFRYFPSKLDVAFPHHEERLRHFEGLLARHLDAEDPLRGVSRAIAAYVDYYHEARDELLAEYTYVATSRELRARDADQDWQFQMAIAAALERAGMTLRHARVLGGVVFGAAQALLFDWFSSGCRGDLRRASREMLDVLEDLARAEATRRNGRATSAVTAARTPARKPAQTAARGGPGALHD